MPLVKKWLTQYVIPGDGSRSLITTTSFTVFIDFFVLSLRSHYFITFDNIKYLNWKKLPTLSELPNIKKNVFYYQDCYRKGVGRVGHTIIYFFDFLTGVWPTTKQFCDFFLQKKVLWYLCIIFFYFFIYFFFYRFWQFCGFFFIFSNFVNSFYGGVKLKIYIY